MAPPAVVLVNPAEGLAGKPDASFQQGYEQYRSGNQAKARTEFQKRLRSLPDDIPSHLGIGYTYLAEQNFDMAEKWVRKALELWPDYPQAHFAMSQIFESTQDYDHAYAELNEVARLNPDYPSIQQSRNIMKLKATEQHLNLGEQLSDRDPQEALRHLKLALDLAPEVPQIPLDIAEILLRENNCTEAVAYLKIAVERNPENSFAKQQLAQCLVQLDEYQPALKLFEELLANDSGNAQIRKQIEQLKKAIFVRNLPSEYQTIPTTDHITRAQFAAYLILQLEFLQNYRSPESKIIVDSIHHWAQTYIQKTVNLGLLDLFPNRTFQPNLTITKLELAKAASRVLEILQSNGSKSIPSGEVVVPDVSSGNVYYPIVAKSISAGVVSLDGDGRFHGSRPVSGAEVISTVNRLKSLSESS